MYNYGIISHEVQLVNIRLWQEDEGKCRLWRNILVAGNKK
jgi:hypothetical protein